MTQAPQIRVFYSMVIKAMIISSTIKLYIATVPFMAHWRALILSEKGIHKITTEEKGAKHKLIDKNLEFERIGKTEIRIKMRKIKFATERKR